VRLLRIHETQKDIILKKLSLSLIALAAISTASFASERNYELRDSDTYFGKYATQLKNSGTTTNALAADADADILTNFERMMKISEENQSGHGNNVSRSRPRVK
jgi:hypothetical protein